MLACVGDLPALRPGSVATVLAGAAAYERAYVPDATGIGTTMLLAAAGVALGPHFQGRSAAAHHSSGATPLTDERLGAAVPDARRDVDTEVDLGDAAGLGLGPATRALLDPVSGRLGTYAVVTTAGSARDAGRRAAVTTDGRPRGAARRPPGRRAAHAAPGPAAARRAGRDDGAVRLALTGARRPRLGGRSPSPATEALRSVPGRKRTTEVGAASLRSPVRGLRTVRAGRSTFSNTPKPVTDTFSPSRRSW